MKNILLFLCLILLSQTALADEKAWQYDLSQHAPGLPKIIIQNEPRVTITIVQDTEVSLSVLAGTIRILKSCIATQLLGVIHRHDHLHSRIEHFGCDASSGINHYH